MRAELLAFACAIILTVASLREPLSIGVIVTLWGVAGIGLICLPHRYRWPAAALLGVAWTAASAQLLMERQLPPTPNPVDVVLEARIIGVPEVRQNRTVLLLAPQRVVAGHLAPPLPRRLRVQWYGATPELEPGQRWRLSLRLRPPSGFLNPEGFDYARWLFAHRIDATGYVRYSAQAALLDHHHGIDWLRYRMATAMEQALTDSPNLGLVQGLGVAVRHQIDDHQWTVLSATGTAHLLAISGLHIGMVAAAVGWLTAAAWRRLPPLTRRVPALIAGSASGAAAAGVYAALAGFTLPTQRALVMVLVFCGSLLARRPLSPWNSLVLAAAAVLLLDPWAPLGAGFWLSFGAVAVILAAAQGRRPAPQGLAAWFRMQTVVGLGLLPATAIWFGHLPWLSPLANLVAVPWVSVVVVPLVLSGVVALALSPSLAAGLWQLADWALVGLMALLGALEAGIGAVDVPPPPTAIAWLSLLGVLYLIAPAGLPGRMLAVPLLAGLAFSPAAPPSGGGRITLFDTGGGLTVIVESETQAVIYGAGPGGSLNAVRTSLAPYIEARRLTPTSWVVPRDGEPWQGAVADGRSRWPDLEWIDSAAQCDQWRRALGGLTLRTRQRGSVCELVVSAGETKVRITPHLAGPPSHSAAFEIGCRLPDAPCKAAVRTASSVSGTFVRSAAEEGAITITRIGQGGVVETEWERRGRIYHRRERRGE